MAKIVTPFLLGFLVVVVSLIMPSSFAELDQDGIRISKYKLTGPSRDIYWGLTSSDNSRTCILLRGLFEVSISYDTNYFSKGLATIMVPRTALVSGFCDKEDDPNLEEITLTWSPPGDGDNIQHNLTFVFVQKSSDPTDPEEDEADEVSSQLKDPYFQVTAVHAVITTNPVEFPEAAEKDKVYDLTASNIRIMSAPESLSYYCKSTQVQVFDDGENSIGMTLVHAEAFHEHIALGDGNDFGPRSFCSKDGFEVILMVLTYLIILALISVGVFYIADVRARRQYEYL